MGGQMIVVRYIFTQTNIPWLQVIFGNTLLHTFSVRDCPGTDCGVFWIWIVDIISRSALLVFSLLRASSYHYKNGSLSYLFLLYKHYRFGELTIFYFFIIMRYTYVGIFTTIVYWNMMIMIFFMFYFKLTWNFAFIKNIESVYLWYYWTQL